MDPPNVSSLPDRSKTIPRTSLPTPIPTTRLSPSLSNSSSPEFQVPQIYFPDPPKLWSRERLTGVIATDSKERNDFIATQWLHLRIHSTARIDDESTKEGKMWISGLKALAKWYQGDPSVRWGRVVEVDRRERGEVVVVCDLRSGHWLNAFVQSKAYAEFWETINPLLTERPRAFYLHGNIGSRTGRVSITDVYFPTHLSDTAKTRVQKMLGRNYFINRSKERNLGSSCSAWIEDDTLELDNQRVLGRRFVSTWLSAEGEAEFKEKENVIVAAGLKLVEDNFWDNLNDLGMLGFEEYHCMLSLIV